jgi:cytoskeletal protein CcmA (bactofilin family)
MALSSFGRGRDTDSNVSSSDSSGQGRAAPAAAKDSGGLTAFIDRGSDFEGKLSFQDTVRIDGRFSGEITSENTLIVGEGGEIHAKIRSATVAISGTVEGDIVATKRLVLHKTAQVTGDVETPCLVIEDGAVFNGQVKMPSGKSGSLKAVAGGVGLAEAKSGGGPAPSSGPLSSS